MSAVPLSATDNTRLWHTRASRSAAAGVTVHGTNVLWTFWRDDTGVTDGGQFSCATHEHAIEMGAALFNELCAELPQ